MPSPGKFGSAEYAREVSEAAAARLDADPFIQRERAAAELHRQLAKELGYPDLSTPTAGVPMDTSTAKAEIAQGKRDLREARQEDIWRQAIEVGRQVQMAGEQRKQTETEGKVLTAGP